MISCVSACLNNSSVKLNVLPLFASLQPANQQRVFQPSKPNTRKIILSTNIAETSLTIPGVRFVVDSCRVKAKVHQASTGLDMLKVVRVSKAQALQRTGRAGREAEGHCYRMLTKAEFDSLEEATVPEIQVWPLTQFFFCFLFVKTHRFAWRANQ